MNIFNINRPCPKCGFEKSRVKWEQGVGWLKRICERCDHFWNEKPLDYGKDEGTKRMVKREGWQFIAEQPRPDNIRDTSDTYLTKDAAERHRHFYRTDLNLVRVEWEEEE